MKNKKGFTLVELIATIVIITVILLLGILTFNKVQETVQNRQFENTKSRIKVAAEKYINDTSVNIVFVETLIKEGYLQADNDGNIIDPRDKSKNLNCYKYENGEVSEGTSENGVCKINGQEPIIYSLQYCDATSDNCTPNTNYDSNKWYNFKKIKLGVSIVGDEIKWFDRKDPSQPITINAIYEYATNSWINQEMNVEVTKGTNRHTMSFNLKIDNAKPTATITNPEDITKEKVKSKTINFEIKDEGSGVAGCIFSSSKNVPSDTTWGKCPNSKTYNLEDNGKVEYLYVKDNAGNVSDGTEIKVQNIIPGCTPGTYNPEKEAGACGKDYHGKICNENGEWETYDDSYPACNACTPKTVKEGTIYPPSNACGGKFCPEVCNDQGTGYEERCSKLPDCPTTPDVPPTPEPTPPGDSVD